MKNKIIYLDFEDFKEARDIVLDILYVSATENRLDREELISVATNLYSLSDKVVGKTEIFKMVRDQIEEGRKEIWSYFWKI